jgi:prepilin-type N-terminal cleavage/methylation domain-containing protein
VRNQRGFTLLEVLVAAAMLSGAIFLSMRSMDIISFGQSQTRNYAKANNIGLTIMEQLLSVYSSDAKITSGAHSQTYDRDGNPVATGAVFTANWTVKWDTPIGKIISIQLQVSWIENGHSHVVNFQTFRQS